MIRNLHVRFLNKTYVIGFCRSLTDFGEHSNRVVVTITCSKKPISV